MGESTPWQAASSLYQHQSLPLSLALHLALGVGNLHWQAEDWKSCLHRLFPDLSTQVCLRMMPLLHGLVALDLARYVMDAVGQILKLATCLLPFSLPGTDQMVQRGLE